MAVMAEEEQQLRLAETDEHIQRILLAIDNFTRRCRILDADHALFRDLTSDFEECLCSIHEEKVERWEEMIWDRSACAAANKQARTLHNAQLQLLHTVCH